MEVKSFSECLIRVDKMISDKSLKCVVNDDLERIRKHIEWKQADIVAKGKEYIEKRQAVLSVLSQINHIKERLYTDDTEEDLDEQYKKLRQRILDWYEVINTKPEIEDHTLSHPFSFQRN